MWKELAGLVGTSAAALAFSFIVVGFLGFKRVSDKGNDTIPRDTRKVIQTWSGRLIGSGIILGFAQFILQVVMEYVSSKLI